MKEKVDIIVSCFNEEDNIFAFFDETKKHLKSDKYSFNIVYVNDGSTDKTKENIRALIKKNETENPEIKVSLISFIRNFGHEAAMCAGLDKSEASYMIFMDVDLQNPPSKIPEIMDAFSKGADTVLLRRVKYNSASLIKKMTSKGYYLFSKYILQNKNARDVSDFFAINRKIADLVKTNYRTTLRFIRSFVQTEAKNIMFVDYENGKRNAGISRYDYIKLLKLAIVSELSRVKKLRDKYKETIDNSIYILE